MFIFLMASLVSYAMINEFLDTEPPEMNAVFYETGHGYDRANNKALIDPLVELKYNNVVRQAYDYSCGSAALTTLLDFYLGRNFKEKQVMDGLLQFGDTERIIRDRAFSLLDMKRLVTALGHTSGGYRAEIEDLVALDHPAIAPIEYAGFKHFVVVRGVKEGHVFIADPAFGNLSFTLSRFVEVWDQNVLFIVFPNGHKPVGGLEIRDEDLRIFDERTFTRLAFQDFNDVFPQDQMRESHEIANGLSRSKNNGYYADDEQNTLMRSGDENFDPSKANIVISDSVVRKTIRFKRK